MTSIELSVSKVAMILNRMRFSPDFLLDHRRVLQIPT